MELQQSYLGDAPSVGFAQRSVTNNFPSGARWVDGMEIVRLYEAHPNTSGKPDGLNEITRSYELQSMQYGRLCSVFSCSVCHVQNEQLTTRQHSYTQVVAFPNKENHSATESYEINQLLAFDDFLTMEEFWRLGKNYTPEPILWEEPQATKSVQLAKLSEIQLALLCRYWRMASNRAFHMNSLPLECICVVPADGATEIQTIDLAKELCCQLLIPCLPKAVGNIVSMSAGMQIDALGYYNPTALAVLTHTGELTTGSRCFDLRNNDFQPLSQNESDFIRFVTAGKTSDLLEELFHRYCAATGNVSREACSFMADYHVAYTIWYLENSHYNGSSEDAVSCLRFLSNILVTAHRLAPELVDDMMAPLVNKVFTSDMKQEVVSADNFKYLLGNISKVTQQVANEQVKLLALHDKHRQEPSFLRAWPVSNPHHERLGQVMEHILLNGYIDPPMGEKERASLSNPAFISYCKEREPIAAAMAKYLRAYTDRYPDQGLFVLPLSTQFLDGRDVLSQSLKLLISSYTDKLPEQSLLDGMKVTEQYWDEENQALLAVYYLECFKKHRSSPMELKPVVDGIGADTTKGLCLVLNNEGQQAGRQEPLSKEKIIELFNTFFARCKNPNAVRKEYVGFVDAVLDESIHSGTNHFVWFCQVSDIPQLMEARDAHNRGIDYMCRLAVTTGKAPDDQSFAQALEWLKTDGITDEQKNMMNTMLNALQPQTRDQAYRTFGMFGNVANYPTLRQVLLESVQNLLIKRWNESGKYWESIDAIAGGMSLGSLKLQEVGEGNEKVTSNGMATLTKLMSVASNQEQFRILLEQGASKQNSPFKTMWDQQLRTTYCMKYNQLFTACANAEEVKRLHLQVSNLNLLNEVQGKEGYINGRLVLEAEDLLVARVRKQIDNYVFYQRTVSLSRYINQQKACQTFHALKRMVTLLAEQHANTDFVGKLLVLLMPADIMEPKEAAVYLLERMLVWNDDLIHKPWANENIQSVMAIANIIHNLSRSDGNRAPLAQAFVDTMIYSQPYSQYTDNVRKNRKKVLEHFPALNKGGDIYRQDLTRELRRWLGGNA